MKLALDTLEAVGDKANDREAVREQLLENTKGRDSVLGTYDIDENGDTTLTDYGLYTIEDGQLDVREGDQGRGRLSPRSGRRIGYVRQRTWGRAPARPRPLTLEANLEAASDPPRRSPEAEDLGGHLGVHLEVRADRAPGRVPGLLRRSRTSSTTGTSPGSATTSSDGLSNGSIWALVALGYTLVYGIIELINFAHGEVFMIGSFVSFGALRHRSGSPPPPAPPAWSSGLFVTSSSRCSSAARST